jgi:hypothetical protein
MEGSINVEFGRDELLFLVLVTGTELTRLGEQGRAKSSHLIKTLQIMERATRHLAQVKRVGVDPSDYVVAMLEKLTKALEKG